MAWLPACSRPPRRKPQPAKSLYDAVGVGGGRRVAVLLLVGVGGLGPTLIRELLASQRYLTITVTTDRAALLRCCHRATLRHRHAAPRFRAPVT